MSTLLGSYFGAGPAKDYDVFKHCLFSLVILFAASFDVMAQNAPAPKAASVPATPVFVVPQLSIVGADVPYAAGDLIDLSVSAIATSPDYLASTSYTWKISEFTYKAGQVSGLTPKRFREYEDGVFFGAGIQSKTVLVECLVTFLYVVKTGDQISEVATRSTLLTTTVTIVGQAPVPVPVPVPPTPVPVPVPPTPIPVPVFPAGTYGLSSTAYNAAMKDVTDPTARANGAAALAAVFTAIGNDASLTDITTALTQTKLKSNTALTNAGVSPASWDLYGTDMQEVVYQFYVDKKLNTTADLKVAWLEIAAGLAKVK